MQFRQQGKRVQVLAYRGYDKERKRAAVKLLGSFDRYSFAMSDGLESSLTDSEKLELQSHIKSIRQSSDDAMRLYRVTSVARDIAEVSECLSENTYASLISRESATATYEAIDLLTRRLRRLGFRRLAKPGPTVATE